MAVKMVASMVMWKVVQKDNNLDTRMVEQKVPLLGMNLVAT